MCAILGFAGKLPEQEKIENAVVGYTQGGGIVEVIPIEAPEWIEIDNPQKLAYAEKIIQKDETGFKIFK